MRVEDTTPDTVVLIHGLWLTPRSWEAWIDRYTNKGYRVLAPAWPGMDAEVEAVNADPSVLERLTVADVVDHYEKVILGLDRPPIILGHSFGGTFAQVLVDRGVGAAAVGVASATVKGVPDLPLSTIRVAAPVLNPLKRGAAVPLTSQQFHYAFANTLSRHESYPLHRRYAVPAAPTVLREYATANLRRNAPTEVDFERAARAPLLLIGFGEDHVMPPTVVRHNAGKYAGSGATTAYHEFPGRPHFPSVPGWEEVADFALNWAAEQAARSPAAR